MVKHPFGVLLKERTIESEFFRLGFHGQEQDDEVKGEGNSVNFKYRMHDPRLGRFFDVDPLIKDYPHYSSYGFSGNIVIHNVELEGLENIHYKVKDQTGNWVSAGNWVDVQSNLDENINCYLYSYPKGGVKKAVYKSIDQGGKDRWEHNGGLAPVDLLTAHYDHDKGPSVNKGFDKTRPMKGEGGNDAGNNGGSYYGVPGMYVAADDIDLVGDILAYIPTPFTKTMGKIIQAEADALRTIADYNTMSTSEATKNTIKRGAAFGVDSGIGKIISKNSNGVKKYIEEQIVRKTVDSVKDANTTKPEVN